MQPSQLPRRRSLGPSIDINLGRQHKPDYWLLALSALLLSIGLIVVYAISPALAIANHVSNSYYVSKQLIAIGLSFVAFFITAQVPISWWRRSYKLLLYVAAAVTLLALILPVNPAYPAHRWIRVGGLSFQSVELVKIAILVWLAGFLSDRLRQGTLTDMKESLKPILAALIGTGIVVAGVQSDLGSTGVIVGIMGTMLFVAGLPMKRIMLVGLIIVVGLFLAISISPYRRARLQTYLHPETNCQSTGYQACQALISVGTGGIIGLGLGGGVQAYGYQPEAANDSIFAIYAEKFGFVGCLVLLAILAGFYNRFKVIAERTTDDFSQLLVVGVLAWLSVQAVINVGAMIGLLPLKGITLPLISYGGTSVVITAASIGLVYQISRYTSFVSPRSSVGGRGTTDRLKNSSLRRATY